MDGFIECAGCGTVIGRLDAIVGWDGKLYCPDCIGHCADEKLPPAGDLDEVLAGGDWIE